MNQQLEKFCGTGTWANMRNRVEGAPCHIPASHQQPRDRGCRFQGTRALSLPRKPRPATLVTPGLPACLLGALINSLG